MSLFNLTNSIVNSKTEAEAKSKLLNSNVLLLNNHEYYEIIISSFIQKKESIIKKENEKLVFDLNNSNDIWNIVFIGEYIKENDLLYKTYNGLVLKIDEIEAELVLIKEKHKVALTQEEHQTINEEYKTLNNELKEYKNQINNMKPVIDTFYNTDWINLVNSSDSIDSLKETKVLKQAISIIHKVRNSFEHDNLDIDSTIHINNNTFDVSIPIEYIDGFNKGKIVANNKDNIIVERTNLIALPLLEELDCNIDDIQSIFYNMDPELLSILLEKANYDVKEIFRLSKRILFEEGEKTKRILEAGFGIDIIEKISYVIEWEFDLKIDEIIETLIYFKKKGLLNDNIITNPHAYGNVASLDLYIRSGVDPEVVDTFNFACFKNLNYAKKLVDRINLLKENGISFNKLIKRFSNTKYPDKIPYDYSEDIIKLKKFFDENNISIEALYDEDLLKEEFFKNPEIFKDLLINKNLMTNLIRPIFWYTIFPDKQEVTRDWVVDYLKKYEIDYRQIGYHGESFEKFKTYLISKGMYPFKEEYKELYKMLEYLRIIESFEKKGIKHYGNSVDKSIAKLIEAGLTIEDIDSLSSTAIDNCNAVIYYMNNNLSLEEIKLVSNFGFTKYEESLELFKYLKTNNIPFNLIEESLWFEPKKLIHILEIIPKEKYKSLENLSYFSYLDEENTINNIEYFKENNIDINNIPFTLFHGGKSIIGFVEWLKQNNYDLKLLEKIPAGAFMGFNHYKFHFDNNVVYSESVETNSLDKYGIVVEYLKNLLKLFIDNGYTINEDLPYKIFSERYYNKENIEYLLKLVDYDFKKLDEFPIEFYKCDYELLDNMCKNYNFNLCKSIFGLDNSKIISSLIYGNSVYSGYQKEYNDFEFIDIDPLIIMHAGFNTSAYYKSNVNSKFDELAYIKQFIYDENNHKRSYEEMKRFLLDKLRNSLAHFRFKPVLDKEDKIVDGMIYIYDSYDESDEHNFDLIIDIKDFVEITRQVELGLLKKKNESFEEHNRFKTR